MNDRFGPDLDVQVLAGEGDSLIRHTAILNRALLPRPFSEWPPLNAGMRIASGNIKHGHVAVLIRVSRATTESRTSANVGGAPMIMPAIAL